MDISPYADRVFEYAGWDNLIHSFTAEQLRRAMYRYPEREKERTLLLYPIGTHVYYNQIICRIGYFYQPKDMPDAELQEKSWEYLLNQLRSLKFSARDLRPDHEITRKDAEAVLCATGLSPAAFFYSIYHSVRSEWVAEQKRIHLNEINWLRTFWYLDIGFNNWKGQRIIGKGKITGKKAKWIGTYRPASNWGEGEYDPPGLNAQIYQEIYQVEDDHTGHIVLVHPLDVKEIK